MHQVARERQSGLGAGDSVGPYRISRMLHTSERAQVFLASHPRLGYPVALKLLARGENAERERTALSSLDNVYTPGLIDFGHFGECPFVVMEHMAGDTLYRVLQVARRLPGARAARIGVHLLRALQYAHSAGLVHGDVKPENVIVAGGRGQELRVSLVDYGEARSERQGAEQSGARLLATAHYAAPEVMRGSAPAASADIYSVGAVLYQCIAGRRPLDCAQAGEIVPLHEVVPIGRALSDLIARAMAESAGHRFPTAREFAARLEALPIAEVQCLAVQSAVASGVQESLDTLQVCEEQAAPPIAAVASRPWKGDGSALLSTGVPEVWAFRGDPGVDQQVVLDALRALDSECRVVMLDSGEREQARVRCLSGAAPPSVMVFGDLHVLLSEPLLGEVSRQNETSMLLISTHENMELLNSTVNACGLHAQVCLPAGADAIASAVRGMLARALQRRRRYDGLRLALRDAQEDLQKLRNELGEREGI